MLSPVVFEFGLEPSGQPVPLDTHEVPGAWKVDDHTHTATHKLLQCCNANSLQIDHMETEAREGRNDDTETEGASPRPSPNLRHVDDCPELLSVDLGAPKSSRDPPELLVDRLDGRNGGREESEGGAAAQQKCSIIYNLEEWLMSVWPRL